jgi:dolichyl-phosphate-mannose-protein mannosyltransferase
MAGHLPILTDVSLTAQVPSGPGPLMTPRAEDMGGQLARRVHRPMPQDHLVGWGLALLVTFIGAVLRWTRLGRPDEFVFDETYYAKDAFSLLRFGYERAFIDGANEVIVGSDGAIHGLDAVFKAEAAYVVHPPLGKWVIALGEWLFGMTPFGWRWSVAVMGTLMVLMVARIVRRITRSSVIGALAGLLVALDGVAIVMSRTALLDGILAFFIVAAFGAMVLDRDMVRARLAQRLERSEVNPASLTGPGLGWRPWLVVAGLMLGAAVAVKWSALWHVAFFGLLVFAWGAGLRRTLGIRRWFTAAVLRDGIPALLPLVALPAAVYVASWSGWLLSSDAWLRTWATTNPSTIGFIPDALRSLWHYHAEAWRFHVGLTSGHNYAASAWSWPVLGRPTSFFYESPQGCGAPTCSQEVIALGNPIIWWAGVMALLHQGWRWLAVRDTRSGMVVVGWLAGWLPWLVFQDRTIFAFYSVVLVPFMCAALAMSLGSLIGAASNGEQTVNSERRSRNVTVVAIFLVAVIAATWFFLPIWTGELITYEQWRMRMWLPTWI